MKVTIKKIIRRLFVYGICYSAVALITAVVTYEVLGPISAASSYSINDFQPIQTALEKYYLQVFTDGKPGYPETLQDLVSRRYMTQDEFNVLSNEYFLEYYNPPKNDGTGTPIILRAIQKMPLVTYNVARQMRMKEAPEPKRAVETATVDAAAARAAESAATPHPAPDANKLFEDAEAVPSPTAESTPAPEPSPSETPAPEATP